MKITTRSGRIVDTPNIRISTERKCRNDIRKANIWLIEQAKIEKKDDEWGLFMIEDLHPDRLTTSDKDILNMILLPDGASEYIYELVKE